MTVPKVTFGIFMPHDILSVQLIFHEVLRVSPAITPHPPRMRQG
jgi:hypothetical protein